MPSSDDLEPDTVPPEAEADEAAHLDAFRAPSIEDEGPPPDDVVQLDDDGEPVADLDSGAQIDKDAFYVVFDHAFGLPGQFVPAFKPLAIQTDEKHRARAASDAIYELLEIYFPAALQPGSDTLARLLVCVPFLIGKVMVARAIMAGPRPEQERPAEFRRSGQGGATGNRATDWLPPEDEAA